MNQIFSKMNMQTSSHRRLKILSNQLLASQTNAHDSQILMEDVFSRKFPTISSTSLFKWKPLLLLGVVGLMTSSSDKKRMESNLEMYGFREKEIRGDGNCQFRALADQLFGDEERHNEVRLKIVDWLRKNKDFEVDEGTKIFDFLDLEEYSSWNEYCDEMSRNGAWGDQFTLVAGAEVFQVNIHILSSIRSKGKIM